MAKGVLIIEARFYAELADALAAGTLAVLEAESVEVERIAVPGVLEIPAALAMAVDSGTQTLIATPHQLGNFSQNRGDIIRQRTTQLQAFLDEHGIDLQVLPGADVRIEDNMMAGLRSGDVLTLADRGRHVLLELPHEMYFPLEPVLRELQSAGMHGILSHPERNLGLLAQPQLLPRWSMRAA